MPPRIKVRGIYATALTAIFLEKGFAVVDPSPVIRDRFGLPEGGGPWEVLVRDRRDKQGVMLEGLRGAVEEALGVLAEALPYALFHPVREERGSPSGAFARLRELRSRYVGEFPKPVKEELDRIRSRYVITLPGHHLLKAISAQDVDRAEEEALRCPQRLPEITREVWRRLVYAHYCVGKAVVVRHLKAGLGGFTWRGKLREMRPGERLVIERRFRPGGRYDGLGELKEEGDFGTVELYERRWWGRRLYFRADGTPLGELYNIHTPPELYPDHVRYLDLEVDVVLRPGAGPEIIDREELLRKVDKGLIPETLARRALEEAEALAEALEGQGPG